MKNSVMPKLRFKEFGGKWEVSLIKDIFNISAGGDISSEYVSNVETEIYKYPIFANAEKSKGLYGYSNLYKIEAPAITVAGRGVNIGIAHYRDKNYYPIVRLLTLKAKSKIDYKFFEYELNNIEFHVESTGVPQLTSPQIGSYKIKYPSTVAEQEKIANYLSALDEKINLLSEKEKNLAQYKKAMMQKLFAQEIRFKDDEGKAFEEWEEKKLGEVAKINKGQQLNKEHFTENGIYKVLNGGISHSGFTNSFNRSKNIITISEGGNSCGYINYMKEDFWLGGHCYSIDNLINGIYDIYLYYYFKFNEALIMSLRVGSGLPNIQKGDLNKFSVQLPCVAEQEKIANFLSAIDEKINAVQKQKEAMQAFKKGMLQQLFV